MTIVASEPTIPVGRVRWRIAYTRIALASRYDFGFWSAWRESGASWEHHDDCRGDESMPTPADAFDMDADEWRLAW